MYMLINNEVRGWPGMRFDVRCDCESYSCDCFLTTSAGLPRMRRVFQDLGARLRQAGTHESEACGHAGHLGPMVGEYSWTAIYDHPHCLQSVVIAM